MNRIWETIIAFIGKIFGKQTIPPEVQNSSTALGEWWDIFRCQAPWIPFTYVTADGVKRNRRRLSLNLAKVACSEMAGLVLAEVPEVAAGDLVARVIARESLWDNLKKTLEYQGALGGQIIKVLLSPREGGAEITLDFVKATAFIPTSWDNAEIFEGIFIDERTVNGKKYVRTETHTREIRPAQINSDDSDTPTQTAAGYLIRNRVYDEETELEVPLSVLGLDLHPEIFVPVDRALFAYVRNPEANNIDPESPLGISLYANAVDTLQAIDMAFDAFKTEILMGRQRVALPSTVMRGYVDATTGKRKLGFDPTDEAYIRLEGDDADKMKPTDLTGQLRVDAFRTGLQMLLDLYAVQTGFSPGHFSFDGISVKTATEVISENSKTFKTMQAYRGALDTGLKHIFRTINELGLYYQIEGATAEEPMITWDDSVIESRDAKAAYWGNLVQNRLASPVRAIKAIHGLDDEAALAEAEAIKDSRAVVLPESLGL